MKILEVKSLKKSFGDLDVINGISLEVNEGEVIGIIGPSDQANLHCSGALPCLKPWIPAN